MRAPLLALARANMRRMSTAASIAHAQESLRIADAVCFDFDSTLIDEEGIDVLAAHCGAGEAVAAWTRKAMGGDVKFEDALEARLKLIEPSTRDVAACLAAHPPRLVDDAAALIRSLTARGTAVYVVSGGLRNMIEPTASELLGVPPERVFANTILFNDDGSYAGFDATEPTSRDGGKPAVIARLKAAGAKTVVMVGDGATDAQAKPPADAFVGFGGVVVRDVVKAKADWFVTSLADLRAALGTAVRPVDNALGGSPVQSIE
jgi:phosphoserine phosphatase